MRLTTNTLRFLLLKVWPQLSRFELHTLSPNTSSCVTTEEEDDILFAPDTVPPQPTDNRVDKQKYLLFLTGQKATI